MPPVLQITPFAFLPSILQVESIFDKFDAGGKGEGDSPTCDPFFLNYKARWV